MVKELFQGKCENVRSLVRLRYIVHTVYCTHPQTYSVLFIVFFLFFFFQPLRTEQPSNAVQESTLRSANEPRFRINKLSE